MRYALNLLELNDAILLFPENNTNGFILSNMTEPMHEILAKVLK